MSDFPNEREFSHWQLHRVDNYLHAKVDVADGGANVLSAGVLEELATIVAGCREHAWVEGLLFSSARNGTFVMGADINEFTRLQSAEEAYALIRKGQSVINSIAELKIPSVAVIDGFALGGGLELAMACDYRVVVAKDKSTLGLPEVKLGIHPGFGGTVRAVQLMGARAALPLMLTGKSLRPAKAQSMGLVDGVAPDLDAAVRKATEWLATRPAKRKAPLLDRVLGWRPLRGFVANKIRAGVRRQARIEHYPAPYAVVDLWERHGANGAAAYDSEARSIADLMVTPTSRNLVRVFFLQNRLKGQGDKNAKALKRVHVIGAGVMGGDIAAWCALRGLDVTLQDRAMKYIEPALERASQLFYKRLKNKDKISSAIQRLRPDTDGSLAADTELVIEAIFENIEAKQALYQAVEKVKPGDAVISTNTSSIPLDELKPAVAKPDWLIGLHFFNPVAMLPLVEVVRTADTARGAIDLGLNFVKQIGKLPLEVSSSPGFLVNRILAPYMAEAMFLAAEGVSLVDIDEAAVAFGMPMGPVELADSVGLDVALHVAEILTAAYGGEIAPALKERVEAGQLGRKSGHGFYPWVDGKAQKPAGTAADLPGDLTDRLILPLVNEAVACLSEGVVEDENLLDAGVIFGTGFAPFRGGPLKYARDRGLSEVRSRLDWLAERHGERFAPRPGWDTLIAEATTSQPIIVQK